MNLPKHDGRGGSDERDGLGDMVPVGTMKDSLGNTALKILAVLEARPGANLRKLSQAVGVYPYAVWRHLHRLRRLGLVRFEDGLACTARLCCRFVPLEELASPSSGEASEASA